MQDASDAVTVVGLGQVFTLFFVTLGPLKLLGPFAQLTHEADETMVRKIALRAFVLAVIAAVVGGFLGRTLIESWSIPVPAMLLAGGLIFVLVGLNLVLEQYHPVHPVPPPLPPNPTAAAMRVTFPLVVTPYGVAALIVVLANSHTTGRTAAVLAILLGVMGLNLIAMLFARKVMGGITLMALQILGAVLGVLQIALAVEMILRALREMNLLPS